MQQQLLEGTINISTNLYKLSSLNYESNSLIVNRFHSIARPHGLNFKQHRKGFVLRIMELRQNDKPAQLINGHIANAPSNSQISAQERSKILLGLVCSLMRKMGVH